MADRTDSEKKHEGCADDCRCPTPAIPPADYKGSQSEWMVGLQQRGLWDGEGFYGDVTIACCDWWKLLEECES